ncbi:hypothetical protein [Nonomuraea sp. CA-141351]
MTAADERLVSGCQGGLLDVPVGELCVARLIIVRRALAGVDLAIALARLS